MNTATLTRIIGKWGIVLGIALALGLSLAACKFTDDIDKLVVNDVPPATVKDGTFVGEQDNAPVTAKVSVDVAGGAILAIKVLAHRHGPGHGADAIGGKVITAQSLRIDAVSGATYSSKVMLKAIENALEMGR
jgi:uncharacterized protein with FMN-binding domain